MKRHRSTFPRLLRNKQQIDRLTHTQYQDLHSWDCQEQSRKPGWCHEYCCVIVRIEIAISSIAHDRDQRQHNTIKSKRSKASHCPQKSQTNIHLTASQNILLIEEAAGQIAIARTPSTDGNQVENVEVITAHNGLLCNTVDLAVEVRRIGSVLCTRDVGLRSSDRVEKDLLQSVAIGCRSNSGSVASALTLGFEKVAVVLVQLELEGGGLVEGPAGDTVDAGSDGEP